MDLNRAKIELTYHGMQLSENALKNLPQNRFRLIVYRDYSTTGGMILKLAPGIYANTPVNQKHSEKSPYTLIFEQGRFFLTKEEGRFGVEVLPPPAFALDSLRLPTGEFIRDLVMIHADRIRISPIYGCANTCAFCSSALLPYNQMPLERLDDAFQIALKDLLCQVRHAFISGGTPLEHPDSYKYQNSIYEFFPDRYPELEFDAMLSPRTLNSGSVTRRKYDNFIKFLWDCSLKDLSINLELVNPNIRRRMIPQKARIGMDNYLYFIEKAVEVFGFRRVRSSIVVGLEEEADTLWGVKALAQRGCIPVLSQFVPTPGTSTARLPAPTPGAQETLLKRAIEISGRYNLPLGPICRPCSHNSLVNYSAAPV